MPSPKSTTMPTDTPESAELDDRYFELLELIKKRPDADEIHRHIKANLRVTLPFFHVANSMPLKSKRQLYADITSAIESGNWSKLQTTELAPKDENQQSSAVLTGPAKQTKSGSIDLKQKYNKTIRGINDGVDAFNRAVVATVKWIAMMIVLLIIVAFIVSVFGSCNFGHPY